MSVLNSRELELFMAASTPSERVRFGVFEADLRSGELRKQGVKIKLHHQPFQVLTMLLEHPGEVVTREELKSKLWPFDTFVDFDVGLNSAVKKLRDALMIDAPVRPSGDAAACLRISAVTTPTDQPAPAVG